MRKISLPLCAGLLALLAMSLGWYSGAAGADAAKAKTPQEVLKLSFKRPAVRATLAQALADLSKLADVKIAVDWAGIIDTGVKPDATVALPAVEATFEKLLEQTLASVATKGNPLAWVMVDDNVVVTTQARVLRKDRMVVASSGGGRATSAPSPSSSGSTVRSAAPHEIKFDGQPLSDVIEFLRNVSNVNFHVNYTALETSGINKDTPITLRVSNVSVAKVLDLIVEQLSGTKGRLDSVYWVVDEGVVKITTGSALDGKLQTRVYDVADLMMAVPNMEGPRLNLTAMTSANTSNTGNSTGNSVWDTTSTQQKTTLTQGPTREDMRKKLTEIIQKSIGEDLWQDKGGKGSISFLQDKMVISQTQLGFLLLEKAAIVK